MRKTLLLTLCMASALIVQGASVKQDGVTIRAGRPSWSQTNGAYSNAGHGYKFVFIDVTIENKSAEDLYVNPVRFELVDDDDAVHSSTVANQNWLQSVTLRSGQKTSGNLAFKIPYNADPEELIFKVSYEKEIRLRL